MEVRSPIGMKSGPIELVFEKFVKAKPVEGLVPVYHFKIIDDRGEVVGNIKFKVGDTVHIKEYAGHIGYEIFPEFRGNSYSYFACEAIRPFVRDFYDKVIITCDPENVPSRKVIEKLNGKFQNEVTISENDPSYKSGSRRKLRYLWQP